MAIRRAGRPGTLAAARCTRPGERAIARLPAPLSGKAGQTVHSGVPCAGLLMTARLRTPFVEGEPLAAPRLTPEQAGGLCTPGGMLGHWRSRRRPAGLCWPPARRAARRGRTARGPGQGRHGHGRAGPGDQFNFIFPLLDYRVRDRRQHRVLRIPDVAAAVLVRRPRAGRPERDLQPGRPGHCHARRAARPRRRSSSSRTAGPTASRSPAGTCSSGSTC